jgi:hypothetical protein
MATVVEYNMDEQRSAVQILWAKAIHNWVEKFSQGRSEVDDETEVRKWLRQLSKDFYPAGFDALIKRQDNCTDVGGAYVEK